MQKFEEEIKEEWERELLEFAKKYEKGNTKNLDKNDLIKELTIKKERKLETINSRRKERERLKTIEMVDQQAKEMVN